MPSAIRSGSQRRRVVARVTLRSLAEWLQHGVLGLFVESGKDQATAAPALEQTAPMSVVASQPVATDGPLPVASSPDFAEAIRALEKNEQRDPETLRAILDDPTQPRDQRFAALYYILFRLERSYSFEQYEETCQKYRPEFGGDAYFDTFMATVKRIHGGASNLRAALTLSDRALAQLSDRPGVLHQYAVIAADLLDADPDSDQHVATSALERIDTAMRLSVRNNSNFHATRARLLARLGDFSLANVEIHAALELEDTTSPDALRRIARFEAVRASILALKNETEFKAIVQESKEQIASIRAEQLQLLGILAAVVALIMVTVATSGRIESEVGAVRFTSITLGGILAVFTGLFFTIQGAKSAWRVVLPLVIAIGLFCFGIWGDALL